MNCSITILFLQIKRKHFQYFYFYNYSNDHFIDKISSYWIHNKLQVSKGNTTVVEPYSGRGLYQIEDDQGLFQAMGGAGSSFGIVTEFLYKIYPRPETQPIISLIYIEDNYDLRKLEKAARDGR